MSGLDIKNVFTLQMKFKEEEKRPRIWRTLAHCNNKLKAPEALVAL
jgi:hypothetical protein